MTDLWKELHTNAYKYTGTNDSAFLTAFGRKIPRYIKGCSCQEFWNNWVRTNPAVYGPNKEYFAWTVKTHNAVNKKLGKPEMTLEDALKLYATQ